MGRTVPSRESRPLSFLGGQLVVLCHDGRLVPACRGVDALSFPLPASTTFPPSRPESSVIPPTKRTNRTDAIYSFHARHKKPTLPAAVSSFGAAAGDRPAGCHGREGTTRLFLRLFAAGKRTSTSGPPSSRSKAKRRGRCRPAGCPTTSVSGPLKDLNGYFPFAPCKSEAEWAVRAERIRRQLLVATGLWPMPARDAAPGRGPWPRGPRRLHGREGLPGELSRAIS